MIQKMNIKGAINDVEGEDAVFSLFEAITAYWPSICPEENSSVGVADVFRGVPFGEYVEGILQRKDVDVLGRYHYSDQALYEGLYDESPRGFSVHPRRVQEMCLITATSHTTCALRMWESRTRGRSSNDRGEPEKKFEIDLDFNGGSMDRAAWAIRAIMAARGALIEGGITWVGKALHPLDKNYDESPGGGLVIDGVEHKYLPLNMRAATGVSTDLLTFQVLCEHLVGETPERETPGEEEEFEELDFSELLTYEKWGQRVMPFVWESSPA